MISDFSTDKIASKYLGKRIEGFSSYNPDIIVPIPRIENRKVYDIDNLNLPFEGWDVWHCYEFSALTKYNLPVTRVLKLRYPACSEYIVESKSLKLYLNSFNMSQFGENTEETLAICKSLIKSDLASALKTEVEVDFLNDNNEHYEIFEKYVDIMSYVDEKKLFIDKFKETPEFLQISKVYEKEHEYYLKFGSLRSNCRVTHQPDFGDLFIYYKSAKEISCDSLVKYFVSFRAEYHFHEECCEMIFKRLHDLLDDNNKLLVCALYTRRGGIDISPVRYSKGLSSDDVDKLVDISKFVRSGIKQ